ncbi:MAG: hypothetical protein WEB60_12955 [Terrimicrobiaceae bacterium]
MTTTTAKPASKPASKTMTGAERRRMVEERCRRSPVWQLIHWLGSLQLALTLFATIAIACAIATFAESEFSAKVAQAYIYKAPWFIVWLIVLCVNLLAVTITRWPWERKHLGFIVTHYGIITLLIGAMVGLHTGFEGNVTLKKDAPPITRVTTSRSVIQLESPADSYLYLKPFDADLAQPSAKRPRIFPVPGMDLKIVADDYAPSLVKVPRLVPSTTVDAAPGLLLRLTSKMASQTLDVPLHLATTPDHDFFGMASLRLLKELPPMAPGGPLETRMVFAKFEPVSDGGPEKSAVTLRLNDDGSRLSIFNAEGNGATYSRQEIMKKPVAEAGAIITVEEYWPDFAMVEGRPATLTQTPNNPAALVRIATQPVDADPKPAFEAEVVGDTANYRLIRAGSPYASGSFKAGDRFSLGWADWEAEVLGVSSASVVANEVLPGEATPGEAEPTPGFLARLESPDGQRGPERWVESGEITSLTDGRNIVRIGYGLETRPMPFSIRLVRFDVPRDEGTETPSNFLATVEFRDAKTGETKTGVAQMNSPASFPGTLVANLTGINYKFSQAEWNPRDLDQTTLQVLYDPGWLLKWFGSLMVCVGIALQFYGKPKN